MIELNIPMGFIDFRRITFVRGAAGIPLKAHIETWLADNGIAYGVSVRKNGTGYRVTFATKPDATLFKLRWL